MPEKKRGWVANCAVLSSATLLGFIMCAGRGGGTVMVTLKPIPSGLEVTIKGDAEDVLGAFSIPHAQNGLSVEVIHPAEYAAIEERPQMQVDRGRQLLNSTDHGIEPEAGLIGYRVIPEGDLREGSIVGLANFSGGFMAVSSALPRLTKPGPSLSPTLVLAAGVRYTDHMQDVLLWGFWEEIQVGSFNLFMDSTTREDIKATISQVLHLMDRVLPTLVTRPDIFVGTFEDQPGGTYVVDDTVVCNANPATAITNEQVITALWRYAAAQLSIEDAFADVVQNNGAKWFGHILSQALVTGKWESGPQKRSEFLDEMYTTLARQSVRPTPYIPAREVPWDNLMPGYLAVLDSSTAVDWKRILAGNTGTLADVPLLNQTIARSRNVTRVFEGDVWGVEVGEVTANGSQESGPVTPAIPLVISFMQYGFLEHCGCKAKQLGGVARRDYLLREMGEGYLKVDCGRFMSQPSGSDHDAVEDARAITMASAMAAMHYDAIIPSFSDLLDYSETVLSVFSVPPGRGKVAAANLWKLSGEQVFPGWIRCEKLLLGESRIVAVVGIVGPPPVELESGALELLSVQGLRLGDIAEDVERAVTGASASSDMVILAGDLDHALVRTLCDLPVVQSKVDFVITGWWMTEDPARLDLAPEARRREKQLSYQIGHVKVFSGGTGVHALTVIEREANAVGGLDARPAVIHDALPRSASIDTIVERMGNVSQAAFSTVTNAADGIYVGAQVCGDCHSSHFSDWMGTQHAHAHNALIHVQRDLHSECVRCHVTGYGAAEGFTVSEKRALLLNVQCEACHGPGGEHAATGRPSSIRLVPSRKTCLTCHDLGHSDEFSGRWESAWKQIEHGAVGAR